MWHAIIIPNYKEPVGKLRQTLDTIASNSIAKQIVVCMAMEARDPNAVRVMQDNVALAGCWAWLRKMALSQ